MTPPEYDEQERREVIGRLEQRYQEAETRRLKGAQDAAIARVDKLNITAQLLRAQTPPDDPNLCLACWAEFADHIPLTPQPSGYGQDILRCRNGHERRVQVR